MNFRPEPCRVTFCVTSFHEPGGPAILTNFPRKFVPDVRFLRDQLGTEETGWVAGGRGFRGVRERKRERQKKERETEAFRKSWASIPGQASRGGLKLLTRLSNSGERRGGKAMAGQKSSFRGYFAPGVSISLSPSALSPSLLFTRPVSLGNQSYFMTFSLRPKNVVVPFESSPVESLLALPSKYQMKRR